MLRIRGREVFGTSNYVNAIALDSAGLMWVATDNGLHTFDGQTWTSLDSELPVAPFDLRDVEIAPNGDVWVASDFGALRNDGTSWIVYTTAADGLPADHVFDISVRSSDGLVAIAANTFDGGNFGGVSVFDGSAWTTYTTANSPLSHFQVVSVAFDRSGDLWVAPLSTGVEEILLGLPPPEAVAVLTPLLKDGSPFVRTEAAYALGKAGDATAVRPLVVMLQKDGAKEARAAAALSLGKVGDTSAVGPLTDVLKKSPSEDNEFIRRSAARSIGEIAEHARANSSKVDQTLFRSAVAVLIKALNNSKETDDTRREAAYALGAMGDRGAIATLNSHLNSPDYYLAEICKKAIAAIEQGQ